MHNVMQRRASVAQGHSLHSIRLQNLTWRRDALRCSDGKLHPSLLGLIEDHQHIPVGPATPHASGCSGPRSFALHLIKRPAKSCLRLAKARHDDEVDGFVSGLAFASPEPRSLDGRIADFTPTTFVGRGRPLHRSASAEALPEVAGDVAGASTGGPNAAGNMRKIRSASGLSDAKARSQSKVTFSEALPVEVPVLSAPTKLQDWPFEAPRQVKPRTDEDRARANMARLYKNHRSLFSWSSLSSKLQGIGMICDSSHYSTGLPWLLTDLKTSC